MHVWIGITHTASENGEAIAVLEPNSTKIDRQIQYETPNSCRKIFKTVIHIYCKRVLVRNQIDSSYTFALETQASLQYRLKLVKFKCYKTKFYYKHHWCLTVKRLHSIYLHDSHWQAFLVNDAQSIYSETK